MIKSNPKVELAVAIVKTTGDRDIFDYSMAVARGWGIGSKQTDNPGALLFVAIDDRKYFTQVSRDLEDELPDGLVGSLQRQYLVPAFKQGDYGKGISDTIDAYIKTIQAKQIGRTRADSAAGKKRKEKQRFVFRQCGLYDIALYFDDYNFQSRRQRRRAAEAAAAAVRFWLPIILSSIANSSGGSSGGSSWGGGGVRPAAAVGAVLAAAAISAAAARRKLVNVTFISQPFN